MKGVSSALSQSFVIISGCFILDALLLFVTFKGTQCVIITVKEVQQLFKFGLSWRWFWCSCSVAFCVTPHGNGPCCGIEGLATQASWQRLYHDHIEVPAQPLICKGKLSLTTLWTCARQTLSIWLLFLMAMSEIANWKPSLRSQAACEILYRGWGLIV